MMKIMIMMKRMMIMKGGKRDSGRGGGGRKEIQRRPPVGGGFFGPPEFHGTAEHKVRGKTVPGKNEILKDSVGAGCCEVDHLSK